MVPPAAIAGGTLPHSPKARDVRIVFFILLLAALVLLAFWRGRTDERLAASVCVGGALLTALVGNRVASESSAFYPLAFLVDFAVLAGFLVIALRSSRFWPMWVAGLQLTTVSIHLLMVVAPDLPGGISLAALAFWSYPILILIAVGAWRTPLVERWRTAHDIASQRGIT
jgi:hypothetical protein